MTGATPDNDAPGEFWCGECGRRCTRSPTDPGLEYGHQRHKDNGSERCPLRSERVEPADDGRAAADVTTVGISGSERDPDTGRFASADEESSDSGEVAG